MLFEGNMNNSLTEVVKLHNEVSQSYHILANMINPGAHTAIHWASCNEESCKLNFNLLAEAVKNDLPILWRDKTN
jgi:hypothetical protein